MSDRVCVIEKGSIIVESTAQEIKDKYGKGYYLSVSHNDHPLDQEEVEKFKHIA